MSRLWLFIHSPSRKGCSLVFYCRKVIMLRGNQILSHQWGDGEERSQLYLTAPVSVPFLCQLFLFPVSWYPSSGMDILCDSRNGARWQVFPKATFVRAGCVKQALHWLQGDQDSAHFHLFHRYVLPPKYLVHQPQSFCSWCGIISAHANLFQVRQAVQVPVNENWGESLRLKFCWALMSCALVKLEEFKTQTCEVKVATV